MRVIECLDNLQQADAFRHHTPRLIEALGTSRFDDVLFKAVEQAFGCAHLTAFFTERGEGTRLIYASNTGKVPIARAAAHRYLDFWNQDPVNLHERRDGAPILLHLLPEEFSKAPFRRQCYAEWEWPHAGAVLVDRVSLVKTRADGVLRVNFYRHRQFGAFSDDSLAHIGAASDLLGSLLIRQHQTQNPLQGRRTIAECREFVKSVLPMLPARECEVCAGIAIGMSSEAIALQLSVSLNTVLTYRKRAYARLGITSQSELSLRLLPAPLAGSAGAWTH